jgi:16S rRNA (guanine(966)-N(2))-methyltransferase RsmD
VRIIGGTAKGRRLETFQGRDIRPTPDRVREAIFSALHSRLGTFSGLSVLDLFAGTGAMALEALSRGAQRAVLVDSGEQASRLARNNLRTCNLNGGRAELVRGDVLRTLPRLAGRGPFDLVFLDPPYGRDLVPRTLAELDRPGLLSEDVLICAEAAVADSVGDRLGSFRRVFHRNYGSTAVHLFLPASQKDDAP